MKQFLGHDSLQVTEVAYPMVVTPSPSGWADKIASALLAIPQGTPIVSC